MTAISILYWFIAKIHSLFYANGRRDSSLTGSCAAIWPGSSMIPDSCCGRLASVTEGDKANALSPCSVALLIFTWKTRFKACWHWKAGIGKHIDAKQFRLQYEALFFKAWSWETWLLNFFDKRNSVHLDSNLWASRKTKKKLWQALIFCSTHARPNYCSWDLWEKPKVVRMHWPKGTQNVKKKV